MAHINNLFLYFINLSLGDAGIIPLFIKDFAPSENGIYPLESIEVPKYSKRCSVFSVFHNFLRNDATNH